MAFSHLCFDIISQLEADGAAARTGKLKMGDRILSVNGQNIRDVTHETAVVALLAKNDEMRLEVQHDPLPSGFMELRVERGEEKLGMIVKGGIQGQPGNPYDEADEGVFISKINEGSVAERENR